MNYQIFEKFYKSFEKLEKENNDFSNGKIKSNWTTIGNNIERPVEWYLRNFIIYSYSLFPKEKQTWLELYAENIQNCFYYFPIHKVIDVWVKWYFDGEN